MNNDNPGGSRTPLEIESKTYPRFTASHRSRGEIQTTTLDTLPSLWVLKSGFSTAVDRTDRV